MPAALLLNPAGQAACLGVALPGRLPFPRRPARPLLLLRWLLLRRPRGVSHGPAGRGRCCWACTGRRRGQQPSQEAQRLPQRLQVSTLSQHSIALRARLGCRLPSIATAAARCCCASWRGRLLKHYLKAAGQQQLQAATHVHNGRLDARICEAHTAELGVGRRRHNVAQELGEHLGCCGARWLGGQLPHRHADRLGRLLHLLWVWGYRRGGMLLRQCCCCWRHCCCRLLQVRLGRLWNRGGSCSAGAGGNRLLRRRRRWRHLQHRPSRWRLPRGRHPSL